MLKNCLWFAISSLQLRTSAWASLVCLDVLQLHVDFADVQLACSAAGPGRLFLHSLWGGGDGIVHSRFA